MMSTYTVETRLGITSDVHSVWHKIRFYEQVKKTPPWLLRLTLPKPLGVLGAHTKQSDLSRCEYVHGEYILKQIVKSVELEELTFDVIEHSRGFRLIRLLGGTIRLENQGPCNTLIAMSTRYSSQAPCFFILRPFVERVIRSMHRFVIADMAECLRTEAAARLGAGQAGVGKA